MIQAEWDSPARRYIYMTLAGRWTWEELDQVITHARQQAAGIDRPFCLVVHVTDEIARSHVPRNVFSYASLSHRISQHNTKTIVVNSNSIGIGIMSIVFRLYPRLRNYYIFVDTMEEAERLINLEYEEGEHR
jgi:hypothetical protein